MKKIKYAVLFIAVVFVIVLWASASDEGTALPPTETTALPPTETTALASQPLLPQITKQDILDLFNGYAYADPDNKQALDCAVVTDSAYDLLGVVLYTTEDYEGCSLDFISKDGVCVGRIGIGASPSEDIQLEYLGDGALSCQLLHTDGNGYLCKIFYVINEKGTFYRVEG